MSYRLILLGDVLCPHCQGTLSANRTLFDLSIDSNHVEAWDLALSGDEKRIARRRGYFQQVMEDIVEWRRLERERPWSVLALDGHRGRVAETDLVMAFARLHDVRMGEKFLALWSGRESASDVLHRNMAASLHLCLDASRKHPDAVWTVGGGW